MRYAILSDVHGNFPAFEAVWQKIQDKGGVDAVYSCGDVVGYGPHPCECIAFAREKGVISVAGNNDRAAVESFFLSKLNDTAKQAVIWTTQHIHESDVHFLKDLPMTITVADATVVHSGSFEPEEFHYLDTYANVARDLEAQATRVAFIGHTHIPAAYRWHAENLYRIDDRTVLLDEQGKYLFNVGSVGQPRDRDARASFVIYDTEANTVEFCRAQYDIDRTVDALAKTDLPPLLKARLKQGW
jgi:predicted phosphodiesterase